jgi:AcrR family transcriptional regulator
MSKRVQCPDTRERLVQTAIRLFAQHGVGNVSLRQITRAAGVNTALLHYHFGSKEDFYEDIIARCINPINETRRRLLSELQTRHGDLDVDDVVRAWAEPLLANEMTAHQLAMILRLHGDIVGQADPFIRKTTEDYSRETIALFKAALRRALPDLSEHEAAWRFYFLIAVVRNLCVDPPLIERLTAGRSSIKSLERFRNELIENVSRMICASGSQSRRTDRQARLRATG